MITYGYVCNLYSLAREITGVLRAIVGAVSVIIERDESVILASNAPQFSSLAIRRTDSTAGGRAMIPSYANIIFCGRLSVLMACAVIRVSNATR